MIFNKTEIKKIGWVFFRKYKPNIISQILEFDQIVYSFGGGGGGGGKHTCLLVYSFSLFLLNRIPKSIGFNSLDTCKNLRHLNKPCTLFSLPPTPNPPPSLYLCYTHLFP